jgi:hypothetical protein
MNVEDQDYLALIKSRNDPDADKRWLIARLEAEAEENRELQDEVIRTKDNALDMQRFQQEKVESAEAECEHLKAQQTAAVCAWEEYARWPDLPSVVVGKIRYPNGKIENLALRPEQITGLLQGIEKHVRDCLPFGVSAVKARQEIDCVRVRAEVAEAERDKLRAEVEWLRETEPRVREYLALSHEDGKCHIYADDGELQCANLVRHGRTIDFRREPLADLLDIIIETRMKEYSALAASG